jgi:diguanylate cyclase (GGDEF)-like protein
MRNRIISLIRQSCSDKEKFIELEGIYELYEQLQYGANIKEMAVFLGDWLHKKYEVDNIKFSLYNLQQDKTTVILKKGDDFFLDGEFSFYFIINTHTENNAVVSFCAKDEQQYRIINGKRDILESAFFQISPILQNGIMKKYHVEASSLDSVTHVYSRKYLIEHIHKITSLSNKEDKTIILMMVGIDRFKAVIDEFDYDIGDKVLVELAKVIFGNIKDFDIVARVTGDEFLIALMDRPDIKDAEETAQKIIEEFAQVEVEVDEEKGQVLKKTCCVGISEYPKDSDDIDQVLKNADMFLYEAKNKGRSSYAVYIKEDESSIDLF